MGDLSKHASEAMDAVGYVKNCEEMNELIDYIKRKKEELLDKTWKELYKERCPEHFISYSKVLEEINLKNWLMNEEALEKFNESFNILKAKEDDAQIWDIVSTAETFKVELPKEFTDMICEACACNGCPYIEEHLGYTCEECKKERHFTGYQGYCDE